MNAISKKIVRRVIPGDSALPDDLHPILKRIYAARQVQCLQELDYSLKHLLPYHRLKGIDTAVDLLEQGLRQGQRMLIVADFDTDGATSCALAMRILKQMGANNISYIVPNRFEHGYGLSPEIIDEAAKYDPDLIITVDNGISSNIGVDHAHALNIKVLITDHHLPAAVLPDADAIVNPQQRGDEFPSKCLAGVGVIFYVLLALRARLRECHWFEDNDRPPPNLAHYLDLVALGSVADMVPLDRNNRIIVARGLARIQSGQGNPGIQALLRVAGKTPATITATDLGFAIAPRLNAAGRLSDMSVGIETLLSDDRETVLSHAKQLDALNRERRKIQAGMQEQALAVIDQTMVESTNGSPTGICWFNPEWHAGIVGLVAGKLKDHFHRPAIIFARERDKLIKGSARSVAGIHIRDVIECIATRNPGLIIRFGGHAMAAGLTVAEEKFEAFQSAFYRVVPEFCDADLLSPDLLTDGELPADMLTVEFAGLLQANGPWGQAFPEPCFDGKFNIINQRLVAGKHLKLALKMNDCAPIVDAIAFNIHDQARPEPLNPIRVAYRLAIDDYQGQKSLQLIIEQLEPCP